MTTHELDAHLDTQHAEYFEPPYHEQLLVMQEFEVARETALKRQGAIEALDTLKNSINNTIIAAHNVGREELLDGLFEAKERINEAIAGYNTPVEASRTFPAGYFDGVQEALDNLTILKGGVL